MVRFTDICEETKNMSRRSKPIELKLGSESFPFPETYNFWYESLKTLIKTGLHPRQYQMTCLRATRCLHVRCFKVVSEVEKAPVGSWGIKYGKSIREDLPVHK